MRAALVAGERDPQVLASLALGSLKRKRPQLELALTGQCTAHHGTLLGLLLELIEMLDRQIATLDQQIGVLVAPLQAQIAPLDSIPGVDIIAARDILAEMGTAMSRSLNLSEFVVASKRAQKRKAEAKEAQGEKAYKAIAEEQRALQSLCDAAYTVNDLPRVQRTVS